MKNIILLSIIILISCAKVEDELIITNEYPKPITLVLNGQKVLTSILPLESISYDVSGLNNVQLPYMNEVLLDTTVLVDGLTYVP